MDSSEETAICSHCNKKVVKSNLPMHEAHCKRFLCLCPDCEEQVPKDQLEEHRQEAHIPIKCKKCNRKMERCKLPDHEANECTERLQNCKFCQLTLPSSNLEEHVVACGSRTERCQDCNQYVMLKDQLQHAQFCTADEFNPAEYEPENLTMSLSDLQKKKNWFEEMAYLDPDQISTCAYCHLALPVKTLKWHEDKCRLFIALRTSKAGDDASRKK